MSKASEFEALAKTANPGPWTRRMSLWEGSVAVEGPCGFDQRGAHGLHILFDDENDADFIAWCGTNRDLIARALRRDEEIENPTILESLASGALNTWRTERALKDPEQLHHVIDAFREAVQ